MRRALNWLGWTVAALVGLLALLVVALLAGANTDPGRRLIERELAAVTGDTVRISGLAGFFPTTLRADRVEIRDATGAYVTIDHVVLDFSPFALLHGEAQIDRIPEQGDAEQHAEDRREQREQHETGGQVLAQ